MNYASPFLLYLRTSTYVAVATLHTYLIISCPIWVHYLAANFFHYVEARFHLIFSLFQIKIRSGIVKLAGFPFIFVRRNFCTIQNRIPLSLSFFSFPVVSLFLLSFSSLISTSTTYSYDRQIANTNNLFLVFVCVIRFVRYLLTVFI